MPFADAIIPCTAGTAAAMIVLLIIVIRSQGSSRGNLPPGPQPLPFIGNLLDIPLSEEWLTWRSYIERYGDLVYLKALGNSYLLLGSQEAITDLIEKRVHFNSRPFPTMLCELMDQIWNLAFQPYGNTWRLGRKMMHSQMHSGAVAHYQPIQLRGARRFIGDLLDAEAHRPADKLSEGAKKVLPHLVRRNFAFTAVHMIYGIDLLHVVSEGAVPGRFWVDYISMIKYIPIWFPGAHFKRLGHKCTILGQQMRNNPMEFVKSQMAATTPPSMAARMLIDFPIGEQIVKNVAGSLYIAGSDTTVGAVTVFFLAMVVYPEVQYRAQQELDRVVGRSRLPEFADKDNLPYLEGVMRECFRWLPTVPEGLWHLTTEDDQYRGYFIPKNTVVMPFQWGLLHNVDVFPEPSLFSPERYLTRIGEDEWKLRADTVDPRNYAFGFGRRVCPGKHIAEQGLFATISTVVHTLRILRVKDSQGIEVIPDTKMTSGLLSHPVPFAYELVMRDNAQKLIELCAEEVN